MTAAKNRLLRDWNSMAHRASQFLTRAFVRCDIWNCAHATCILTLCIDKSQVVNRVKKAQDGSSVQCLFLEISWSLLKAAKIQSQTNIQVPKKGKDWNFKKVPNIFNVKDTKSCISADESLSRMAYLKGFLKFLRPRSQVLIIHLGSRFWKKF